MARARVTIKLEGVKELHKILEQKRGEIIEAGEKTIKDHMDKQLVSARANIHSISGETAASLSAKIDGKSDNFVVGKVGAFDSAEDAIRANSLEFGHAAPNQAGGAKVVPAHPFLRPAVDEDEKSYKKDFRKAIKDAIEK